MQKATIRDLVNMRGKRVFIRVDHNVPQDDSGAITDDTRIRESLGTIRYCLEKGARVILCSHLGRPEGREPQWSLAPVAKRLGELLPKTKIIMAKDCIGPTVETQISNLANGEILMLENIRFYKEETKNDAAFSKKLANLADYYVNDAFGTAHRAHSSTEGIAHNLPAVAGFLLEKEIKILGEGIDRPKRPLTVILGGKKVSDKIGVIDNLLKVANNILIGGGMMFTFAKAAGGNIGNSVLDSASLDYCKNVIEAAKRKKVNLVVAADCIAADEFNNDANTQTTDAGSVPDGWQGLDIGPKATEAFSKVIAQSGTIIWNGPMGVFEMDTFAKGTREIMNTITENTNAVTIVGGGDTAFAVTKLGLADRFTHVSTGGGASLELLEGKILPGVAALLPADAEIK